MKLTKILIFLLMALLAACNDKPSDSAPAPTPSPDISVTPGALEITILKPAVNGTSLSSYSVISGECGIPGSPVEVSGGGVTLYSICQNDYSWYAPITAVSAPVGTVEYTVKLRDKLLTTSSPIVTRSFFKKDDVCINPANRGKLYANIDSADGVSVAYKICTPTQFSNIRFNPAKKFEIAQDIDFADITIVPISIAFSGELDGQGFMLKNFTVKDLGGTGTSVGLFRYIQGATIRNLNIRSATIDATQRVGILAGDWRGGGLIENVKIQGSVKAVTMAGGLIGLGNTAFSLTMRNIQAETNVTANNYTGGVIGYVNTNDGSFTMENCQIRSNVSGNTWTGGIAGNIFEDNTTFTNVSHRGNINSLTEKVAGLIGEANGGTFSNVSHIGSVTTPKDNADTYAGGLFGLTTKPVIINGANVVSNISAGGNYTGGLVGRLYSGSINNAISRVTINVEDNQFNAAQKFVGGLFGANNLDATIADSHAVVTLNAKAYYVGGLVGNMNGANSSIQRSWVSGSINGRVSHIAGLVGNFLGSSITQSFSRANISVSGPTPNSYVGGIVGFTNNSNATFTRLYNSGNITFTDGTPDNVGGIFGYVKALSVKQAYASGNITGVRSKVGGIAGYLWAPLSESYFSGQVIASLRYVGGLAGISYQSSLTNNFVQSALLQGSGEVGGLAGWLIEGNGAQITNGYFSGHLKKNASSALDDVTFGAITGLKDANATLNNVFFESASTFIRLSDSQNIARNSLGVSLTNASMRSSANYAGFNFTSSPTAYNWQMPTAGFKLPFASNDYVFAIHDWLTEANQGFTLPVTYTDDPINQVQPEFFDPYQTILTSFSQEEFNIISSPTAPTSVTPGQQQISFVYPSSDGLPIATKLLIYGECGIPGGKVSISGSFIINTVCQSNHRWSAVIDATNKPVGNLTVTIKLANLAQTATSPAVTRILNKNSSLCSDPVAIKGQFANSHLGGNGTTVPYQICHVGHLRNIAFNPTANIDLANDVDFGGNSFEPILTAYKGIFDGKSFRLRNMLISKTSTSVVGMFSAVQNATLKNVTFEKFSVTGYERTGVFAGDWRGTGTIENVVFRDGTLNGVLTTGVVAGLANTTSALVINGLTIQNVTVSSNNYTGGAIGFQSTVDGSFNAQNITLTNLIVNGLGSTGGLVGNLLQPNSVISGVTATGLKVTGMAEKVGGLVGNLHSANLTNINITGELNAPKDAVEISAGGIVGEATQALNLNNIRWTGPVNSGSDNVGGIAGKVTNLTANNIISSGILTINDDRYNSVRKNVGGLVGLILGTTSTVDNSSSTMTLNVNSQYAGGLFGRFEGEFSTIKNSYFSGTLNARTSFVGGLAGIFDGKDLWDSYSNGAVNVNTPTPNAYLGGLVGYANSQTSNYKRLRASGHVTITNGTADYVGGLIGFFRGGTLEDSSASGNINGARTVVGGLVGMMRGSLDRSYSLGNVAASGRHGGGLVGYLNLAGYIRDSFAKGNVTANDESGGLVGYVNTTHGQVAVLRSYAFGQVTKLPASIAPDANFGAIYGTTANPTQIDAASTYFLASKANPLHNGAGYSVADASASVQASYPGFDFVSIPGWRMPLATLSVPGYGVNYPYPILDWINSASTVPTYKVRGTIAGLQYGSMTLSLNGGEEAIIVSAPNNSFLFTRQLEPGQAYSVTISEHPTNPAITCTVSNAAGNMGNGDVTNITVSCPTFQSINIAASSTMSSSATQAVVVNGTLSNTVVVNLTGIANLTSSNTTNFTLSGANLTSNSGGTTTLNASFLALTASRSVTAIAPPSPPSSPVWQGTSPASTTAIIAQWALSPTPSIASQRIDYYPTNNCTGSASLTKNLSAIATSDSFTGSDTLTYTFKVTAIDSSSLIAVSGCSNAMLITLPTPNPITNLIASAAWLTGDLPLSSPTFSWTNPANITGVEVTLGNTAGGSQIAPWTSQAVVNSYTFTNLNALTNCTIYFGSVRTVNQYNKKSSVVTHLGFRWDNGAPSSPGSVTTSGSATSTIATTASWGASTDNCILNSYEVAIGTTAGGTDISGGWKNIGNVTSYQPTSGVGGFNFTLAANTDYFTSVRAKDQAGNYSALATSAGWQLPASGLTKLLWFDASDRVSIKDGTLLTPDDPSYSGKVRTWEDKSSTGVHDAVSPGAANDPGFDSVKNNVTFSGSSQYLTIPTSANYDNSIFTFKNIFVSFKTPVDVTTRQVIYKQGDRVRGLNLYIVNGKLYCGFFNNRNDGDGTQAILSAASATDLAPNTTYHAALVYDYTNYTTATGANGSVKCYLNNVQIGTTLSTTSRLYAQPSGGSIGSSFGGTLFHDLSENATNWYFKGRVLEAISYTTNPSASDISNTISTLMQKWSAGELSSPGNLTIVNNSTLTKAVTASWSPVSSSSFQTDHYEVGIGTSSSNTDILYWANIGNVTTYTPEDGIGGLSLSLQYGTDYYFMVKAVDVYGNESSVAASSSWRVLPPGSTTLGGTFLSLDASDFSNVLDGAGVAAGQTGFANVVATWKNKINTAVNSFTQTTAASRPTFSTSLKSAYFDKTNDFMSTPAEANLGNSTVTAKALTLVFTTGSDVTTRQFLFELGDRSTSGLSIYIEAGQLYGLYHQNTNGGDGIQVPVWINTTVSASTSYVVTLYMNYTNYTGAAGPNGVIGMMVNGLNIGTIATTSRWIASTQIGYLGYRNGARWHNSNANTAGDYFGGEIHELQMTNTWPAGGSTDIQNLHNILMSKW